MVGKVTIDGCRWLLGDLIPSEVAWEPVTMALDGVDPIRMS